MARSLTVKHEENPSTSNLLNGFLVFALAWMLLSAWTWSSADDGTDLGSGALEAGALP